MGPLWSLLGPPVGKMNLVSVQALKGVITGVVIKTFSRFAFLLFFIFLPRVLLPHVTRTVPGTSSFVLIAVRPLINFVSSLCRDIPAPISHFGQA